ncbi:DUF3616 domain-containing protein [Sphingomonas spermidinifaciens]|uniref:DUF3616 domain-containing protein n=1 Tax=Sphingomonas spermidinifaciens TaxID=1141889 RepID=UPI0015969D3D|nr:DUF3616 domain-containing protein [Sphingomonas spermidinifaciens]
MLPRQSFNAARLPAPRAAIGHLRLEFAGAPDEEDHPINDLSGAAFVGTTLFVAGDEGARIERLVPTAPGVWGEHRAFDLAALLGLEGEGEIDVEGLAYAEDDWLWVTGSHARTRPKPKRREGEDGAARIDVARMADLKDTQARCLLARLPLAVGADGRVAPVARDGKRRAGHVKLTKGHGSKLARLFAEHPLTGPFTRIAAKEGGLDIEGIAVAGGRVALGLRGPVVADFALIAEPVIVPRKRGRLTVGPDLALRLVDLDGMGIRDLKLDGDDLVILAGPTQAIDGRCAVFRWEGWRHDLPTNATEAAVHRPRHLFDLPVRMGFDRPEAIEWLPGGAGRRLVVLHDGPCPDRVDPTRCAVTGDVIALAG